MAGLIEKKGKSNAPLVGPENRLIGANTALDVENLVLDAEIVITEGRLVNNLKGLTAAERILLNAFHPKTP